MGIGGLYDPEDDSGDDLKGSAYKSGLFQGGINATAQAGKYGTQVLNYYKNVLAPFFGEAQGQSNMLFGAAPATQKDILGLLGKGFDNARANVAEQGRLGTQGILDSQTQALGATQQAGVDSGMFGGTAQATMNRGVAQDTARALAGLQASLGQLYSGLDVGQAQAQAGALTGSSSLFAQQAGSQQDYLSQLLSGLNGTPIEPKQDSGFGSIFGGLLGGLGSFFGAGGGK